MLFFCNIFTLTFHISFYGFFMRRLSMFFFLGFYFTLDRNKKKLLKKINEVFFLFTLRIKNNFMFDVFYILIFFIWHFQIMTGENQIGIIFKGKKVSSMIFYRFKIQFTFHFPLELKNCIAHFAANPSVIFLNLISFFSVVYLNSNFK